MPDTNDMDLVREFARDNSEAAFAELVRRHINLVYSVALRFNGNVADAQDVTQTVFIILAQKAAGLRERTVLTGWLYETTRFVAARSVRTQARRQAREQEAYMESTLNTFNSESTWRQLAPHLEAAMSRLGEHDRTLLALRFYENKSGAEAAALLGIQEAAAHKRTARALEKLHHYFTRQGVVSTTTMIAGAISANSIQAAPAELAKTVTAIALAKGATTLGAATLGATAAKGTASAKITGVLGMFAIFIGPLIVMAPHYLGYRLGMAGAQSDQERGHIKAFYRKISLITWGLFVPFVAVVLWLSRNQTDRSYLSGVFATGLMIIFLPTISIFSRNAVRKGREYYTRIVAEKYGGILPAPAWEYRSKTNFLGLPLVHIRFDSKFGILRAPVKAWIAVGHQAVGGLFAFGGTAIAPLSLGGLSMGVLSCGGLSLGIFALGGVALGVWTFFGGLIAGWQAFGGCISIAWNAAMGDFAWAHDFALGRFAHAAQANNDLANQFIKSNWFYHCAQFIGNHWLWMNLVWVIPFFLQWQVARRAKRLQKPI